jgi:hypothetical protein
MRKVESSTETEWYAKRLSQKCPHFCATVVLSELVARHSGATRQEEALAGGNRWHSLGSSVYSLTWVKAQVLHHQMICLRWRLGAAPTHMLRHQQHHACTYKRLNGSCAVWCGAIFKHLVAIFLLAR